MGLQGYWENASVPCNVLCTPSQGIKCLRFIAAQLTHLRRLPLNQSLASTLCTPQVDV